VLIREKILKKDMKNFLYYNSVAAHPHYLMGNDLEDHQFDGLFKYQTLDIINIMNKWMKKPGEVLT
jgi:hypothetical protein